MSSIEKRSLSDVEAAAHPNDTSTTTNAAITQQEQEEDHTISSCSRPEGDGISEEFILPDNNLLASSTSLPLPSQVTPIQRTSTASNSRDSLIKSTATSQDYATPLQVKANISSKSTTNSANNQQDSPLQHPDLVLSESMTKADIHDPSPDPSLCKSQAAAATPGNSALMIAELDSIVADSIAPLPSQPSKPAEPSVPGAFAVISNGDLRPAGAGFWHQGQPSLAEQQLANNTTGGCYHRGSSSGEATTDEEDKTSIVLRNEDNVEGGLVEATPLANEDPLLEPMASAVLESAENVQSRASQQRQKNTRFYGSILAALVVLLLAAGIIGYMVGQSSDKDDMEDTKDADSPDRVNRTSTNSPTAAPLLSFAQQLSPTTLDLILQQDASSPQYQAYQWIQQDPNLEELDDYRLLQRFAAASFYYSTQGESWTHQGGDSILIDIGPPNKPDYTLNLTMDPWVSYDTNECNWFSVPTNPQDMTGGLCDGADGKSLVNLNLFHNNLNGSVPEEIGLLTDLEQVHLYRNDALQGTLPTALGLLDQLNYWSTRFCGLRGSIPSELGRLSNTLSYFNSFKNQHTGSIPTQLFDLPRLEALRLGRNQLTGSLPSHIQLPRLQLFRLSRNQMTGTIPTSLGTTCTDLQELDLAFNQFRGSLPSQLGLLEQLVELELGDNQFTGTLPTQMGRLTNLVSFNVEQNAAITGSIPSEMGLLESLGALRLGGNQLTGNLPSQLGLLTGLVSIHLEDNPQLGGSLPMEWRSLNASLHALSIQGTALSGSVPLELCGIQALSFDCSAWLCGCDCTCANTNPLVNNITNDTTTSSNNNSFV